MTAGAFVDSDPTDEPLISSLPVARLQSGPVMARMGVAILPSAALSESLHLLSAMNLPRRGGVHRFRQILYQRHDKAHFTALAADRACLSVIERFAVGSSRPCAPIAA